MDNVNSIERQFADLIALLRKPVARSVGTLWAAFGALPDSFEPDECANYFRHTG